MNSDQKLEKKIKDLETKLDNLNKGTSNIENSESQKKEEDIYDKYSFLNKPELSDITKAYLSAYLDDDSQPKAELSDFSKAYMTGLTDYNNNNAHEEKIERPALSGLTMEFLKDNDEIEEKKEENEEEIKEDNKNEEINEEKKEEGNN